MEVVGEVMPEESLRAIKRDLIKKDIYKKLNEIKLKPVEDERSNSGKKEKSVTVKDRS